MTQKTKVALAREGDVNAREAIYRKYYGDVYRYCVYRCGDIHLGEDLAQETFLRLYRYKDISESDVSVKAYIMKVACNVCNSHASSYVPTAPLDRTARSDDVPLLTPEQESVRYAIASLSEDQRQVIVLYYFNSLRLAEIARILELPLPTVKSRMRRGREQLKKILIQEGFN